MKVANRVGRIVTTERWFVHRGMPQAIVDYSATTDVFTRMAPVLALVTIGEVFLSFGDRFAGWAQALVFVAAVAILVAGIVVVNRFRGRRPLALPDDIRTAELVGFVVVPAVVAGAFGSDGIVTAAIVAGANLAVLGLGYLVTRFGVIPMIGWGIAQFGRQLRHIVHLLARGLPLLLLFSAFLFLNAEMWQVAHELTPVFYAVVLTMVVALAVFFTAMRLPAERDHLARFDTWDEVCALAEASDAPYGADERPDRPDPPQLPPLTRADRINVVLLLLVGQAVQLVIVAGSIGLFYVVFGLFTVRTETLLQWTTIDPATWDPLVTFTVAGDDLVLTWELLAVAGFVAAFSGLQFTVSALTDQTYRENFFSDSGDAIREVLAVRALYRFDYEASVAAGELD